MEKQDGETASLSPASSGVSPIAEGGSDQSFPFTKGGGTATLEKERGDE